MFLGLSYYFILMDLYLYSFFGWIYESTYVSLRNHKLVNRGFLIGPILPLYGFGGTLVYVFLRPLEEHPSLLFAGGMVLATMIEYLTSWIMEKLFHTRWWDYSNEPYNFQGRIALIPSMFWGFLSLLAFDFLQPGVSAIINAIPYHTGVILLSVALVITAADLTYTVFTTISFSKQLESLYHFRAELMQMVEESQYSSLRDIITSKTQNLNERTENFHKHLQELKENYKDSDSRLANIEARFHEYQEKHFSFRRKNHAFGGGRLIQAFPTMKFIPKNSGKFSKDLHNLRVREFVSQFSDKLSTDSASKHTKPSQKSSDEKKE